MIITAIILLHLVFSAKAVYPGFGIQAKADGEGSAKVNGVGTTHIKATTWTDVRSNSHPVFIVIEYRNFHDIGGFTVQDLPGGARYKITYKDMWYCKSYQDSASMRSDRHSMDFNEARYGYKRTKAVTIRGEENWQTSTDSQTLKKVHCRGYLPDVDECSSGPCQNGGRCSNLRGRYSCSCGYGYTGSRCTTSPTFLMEVHGDDFLYYYVDGVYRGRVKYTDKVKRYVSHVRPVFVAFKVENPYGFGGFVINGHYVSYKTKWFCTPAFKYYKSKKYGPFATAPTSWLSRDFNEQRPPSSAAPWTNRVKWVVRNGLRYGTTSDFEVNYKHKFNPDYRKDLFCRGYLPDVNECASIPCRNRGRCNNYRGRFVCSCVRGYVDAKCSTDVNECASSPCKNGGSCLNQVGRYKCECKPGFSGSQCYTDINECSSSPCVNGGTCKNLVNAFQCLCIPGFIDEKCSKNVDECASDPCIHEGTCVDGVNRFTCQCSTGYTGVTCETPVEGGEGKVEINLGYKTLGCFAFNSEHFSKSSEHEPFIDFERDEMWTLEGCSEKCRFSISYTYAGVETKNNKKCRCFNNILKMPIVFENQTCPNSTLSLQYSTISVATTCPDMYYNPPLCTSRSRPTCSTSKMYATSRYDGKCEVCAKNEGETGWEKCHSLNDLNFNIDMRHYASGLHDFQKNYVSSPTGYPYNQDTAGISLARNHPSQFTSRSDIAVYIHTVTAQLVAQGACFFSLWDKFKNEVGDRQVRLIDKLLMNSDTNFKVKAFTDLNIEVPQEFLPTAVIGVHSIDTKEPLGNPNLRRSYSGIVSYHMDETAYKRGGTGWWTGKTKEYQPLEINRDSFDRLDGAGWVTGQKLPVYHCFSGENCPGSPRPKRAFLIAMQAKFLVTCPPNCLKGTCTSDFKCSHGCEAGFYGVCCDKECDFRTYGESCAKICSVGCVGQKCDGKTGICTDGCGIGSVGTYCDEVCPQGTYGLECKSSCSKFCSTAHDCDPRTGECLKGCALGYEAPFCMDTCKNKKWGPSCLETCGNCKGGESCDAFKGSCTSGCEEPYLPNNCICKGGTWGPDCTKSCGTCLLNKPCDPETGYCPGLSPTIGMTATNYNPSDVCSNNTQPPMCVCEIGFYGPDCDQECGNCLKGLCASNGSCVLGCGPGFTGGSCTTPCPANTYGAGCNSTCPACAKTCNSVDGSCPDGECTGNFKKPTCTGCKDRFYGDKCTEVCGFCAAYETCLRDGTCQGDDSKLQDPFIGSLLDIVSGTKVPAKALSDEGEVDPRSADSPIAAALMDIPLGAQSDNSFANNLKRDEQSEDVYFHRPGTVGELIDAIDKGALVGKHITSEQCEAIRDIVASACEGDFQGPLCACKVGKYGDDCEKECGHCLAGCMKDGKCLGGCGPGFNGPMCDTACDANFFGPNCVFACGFCKNKTSCTPADGVCADGCQPGYMPPYCKCPLGRYGDKCEHECYNCKESTTCSFENGMCTEGCQQGYLMPYCNCSVGHYGLDCSRFCGSCLFGQQCDVFNGTCPGGCEPGFIPPFCTKRCEPGFYGLGCSTKCGNCEGCVACDVINGSCPNSDCDSGYMPPVCVDMCEAGKYGPNCEKECGNCFMERPCDPIDGYCDSGCVMGYMSPLCHEPCPNKTWGYNCQKECGFCLNNANCDIWNGKCEKCLPHYIEPFCTEPTVTPPPEPSPCEEYRYMPPGCNMTCGRCLGNGSCHGITGYCLAGCDPGYQPVFCKDVCEGLMWGQNCMMQCGNCKDYLPCRKTDGQCEEGCEAGWYGPTCTYDSESQLAVYGNATGTAVQLYKKLSGPACVSIAVVAWLIPSEKFRYLT